MNLINFTVSNQEISTLLTNWIDSKPIPQLVDSFTYDLYESNNPFRKTFDEKEINNKGLRIVANTTASVTAEAFSAFANPFYIGHKITNIPVYYQNAVNLYKNNNN